MLLWHPLYVFRREILSINFIILQNSYRYFVFVAIKIHFAEKLET